MSWVTAPTFVPGPLASSDLNKLSDDLNVIGGVWTTDVRSAGAIWTAATVNPSIGNGTLSSRYVATGKTVEWFVQITAGSTTTFGTGQWQLVPPVAPRVDVGTVKPAGGALDQSAGDRYPLFVIGGNGVGFVVQCINGASAAKTTTVNATTPMTWATSDILEITIRYEAA